MENRYLGRMWVGVNFYKYFGRGPTVEPGGGGGVHRSESGAGRIGGGSEGLPVRRLCGGGGGQRVGAEGLDELPGQEELGGERGGVPAAVVCWGRSDAAKRQGGDRQGEDQGRDRTRGRVEFGRSAAAAGAAHDRRGGAGEQGVCQRGV